MSLKFAPPPKVVDGLYAVPIEIQSVTAQVSFDVSATTAPASATMNFKMGNFTGRPIFDLRQTISSAVLDGSPIVASKLGYHNFNGDWRSRLRVIDQQLLPARSIPWSSATRSGSRRPTIHSPLAGKARRQV